MRNLLELDGYRNAEHEFRITGGLGNELAGCFRLASPVDKRPLSIIASREVGGWDHVSISRPDRCPTWEEMDAVKRLFFHPNEVAMQLHPAESEHISNHPTCLHIWRPCKGEIPLPPSAMVGLKGLSPSQVKQIMQQVQGGHQRIDLTR